jgi:hypothetical protein
VQHVLADDQRLQRNTLKTKPEAALDLVLPMPLPQDPQ